MSEPKETLTEALDEVLREYNDADDEYRERKAASDDASRRVNKLANEALRLRRALWALEGRVLGDIDSRDGVREANDKRARELKQGALTAEASA